MKNLLTVSLVILSILILSLKDTLNLAHIILHKIPNPFHYHHNFSHNHELNGPDSGHHHHEEQDDDHHHEFEHDDDHYTSETYLSHTLKDHINLSVEENDKESKEDIENSLKINWYINSFYSLKHQAFFKLIRIENYFTLNCFRLYTSAPLSPPPES